MSRYRIIDEIKADVRTIEKLLLDADDGYVEGRWQEAKAVIRELAETCKGIMKERKETDRRERKDRRAGQLNTTQLAALRHALGDPDGRITIGDRTTLKALRDRGYAIEIHGGTERTPAGFYITPQGRERARYAADVARAGTSETAPDPSLMKDLPDPPQSEISHQPFGEGPA